MKTNSWGLTERSLQVFVSSPSDVAKEREEISQVIEEVNRTLGTKIGVFLRVRMWETLHPRGENIMNFIERQLEDCDLFVMILSRRFGSPPCNGSQFVSGTEQEYSVARRLRDKSGSRPEMFLYFKRCTDDAVLADPGPQFQKVLDFKQKVRDSAFYREYISAETFRLEFKDHLIAWLVGMVDTLSANSEAMRKRRVLQKLFSLGHVPDHPPSCLIVYPNATQGSVMCDGMNVSLRDEPRPFDVSHLLPYMVLEDFQAIHKLTKCLNIAGCEEVAASTVNVYDAQAERRHNKVFLCVPRNEHARKLLSDIPEAAMSISGNNPQERTLHWHNEYGSLAIKSPQSTYLRLQRNPKDHWHTDPGECYCEDFAVIARFRNRAVEPNLSSLSNMFLFGLRGLGTWGASWYIDHCYSDLVNRLDDSGTYRALLHVVFENNRIRYVTDVSTKDQTFFDTLSNEDHVRKTLSEHNRRIVGKTPSKGNGVSRNYTGWSI